MKIKPYTLAVCSYCGRTLKAFWGKGFYGLPRMFNHDQVWGMAETEVRLPCRGSKCFATRIIDVLEKDKS